MLLWLGGVIVLFAGLLLPFIWVPIVLWLIWTWRRKRKNDQAPGSAGADAGVQPTIDAGAAGTANTVEDEEAESLNETAESAETTEPVATAEPE